MRTEKEISERLEEIKSTNVCSPSPEADGLYWIQTVLEWVLEIHDEHSDHLDWESFKDECEAGPRALAGIKIK